MEKIGVIVNNQSSFELPEYKSVGASGMDVKADLNRTFGVNIMSNEGITPIVKPMINGRDMNPSILHLLPLETKIIQTGLFVDIPEGYEIQVRSRSGLSLKGVVVMNAPGTIDSDYRGEIGVILANLSDKEVIINHGDRIAQLVLCPVMKIEWDLTKSISNTDRGAGGYGSTGK